MSARLLHLRRLRGGGAVLLALGGFLQSAQGVTLEWDPSPDVQVAGYVVYYGTARGQHTVRLEVGKRTSATITNLVTGTTYYFVATTYSFDGHQSVPSNEVEYTVPVNEPPRVTAGVDQAILQSSTTILTGEVSDDGLPFWGEVLSEQWSVVSGPGPVSFGSATALSTSASFTTAGAYLIRLTASDGELATSDDLVVTVVPDVPKYPVGLVVEAENGWLSYPMRRGWSVSTDGTPTLAVYLSQAAEKGTASCALEVPEDGAYVIWARLLAPEGTNTPFQVRCDDALEGLLAADASAYPPNTWHWVCLTGVSGDRESKGPDPSGVEPAPLVLPLTAGPHLITVSGGGTGLRLDKLLVTNKRSFVPAKGGGTPSTPVISGLRFDAGGVRATWSSTSGAVYRLVYRDELSDSAWLPASPRIVAVGDSVSWVHAAVGASNQRYYSILLLPE